MHDAVFAHVSQKFLSAHDSSAKGVTVTVQILGGAVDHHIGAELDRFLLNQSRPRTVHDHGGAGFVSDGSYFFNIADCDDGVAGRFDKYSLGGGTQGLLNRFQIGGIHQAYLDSEPRQMNAQQFLSTGIAYFRGNDMVAGIEQGEKDCRDCAHTTGCHHAIFTLLEGRQTCFQITRCGAVLAGVLKFIEVIPGENFEQFFDIDGQLVGIGHVNRAPQRAGLLIDAFP